jgi:hypothetical protein
MMQYKIVTKHSRHTWYEFEAKSVYHGEEVFKRWLEDNIMPDRYKRFHLKTIEE